jgi:hypothetical protein
MSTPPLNEDTADSRPRGVFFDLSMAPGVSPQLPASSSTGSSKGTPRGERRRGSITKKATDCFDYHSKKNPGKGKTSYFDFDVPKHLPNSSLCPAHPQHKGGGKGVCVVSDALI